MQVISPQEASDSGDLGAYAGDQTRKVQPMPTYVCSVPPRLLDDKQKAEIAQAISQRHSEATGAEPFFVQVQIDETPSRQRFLGGTSTNDHIWVRGDIRAGRPEDVRQRLMVNIMQDISEIAGIPSSAVWIHLCNLTATDMLEHGHVLPMPGQEQQWFAALPETLQQYLTSLGTRSGEARL
jgi:phenylpyruvate tautomerase PptA (4-oxalocrotonate tautomerase family)